MATANPLINTDPMGLRVLAPEAGGAFRGIGAGVGALHPGGTGAMIGTVVGGTGGALAGSLIPVPGMTIAVGVAGGMVGGAIGSVFDNPCAGLPNCGEAEDLRRWREQKEIEEIQRDLERAQQLLDRLNRITEAMMDILQSRAKP